MDESVEKSSRLVEAGDAVGGVVVEKHVERVVKVGDLLL
jgi:hypothetical protein